MTDKLNFFISALWFNIAQTVYFLFTFLKNPKNVCYKAVRKILEYVCSVGIWEYKQKQ